jgi:hypothetical protein
MFTFLLPKKNIYIITKILALTNSNASFKNIFVTQMAALTSTVVKSTKLQRT